MGRRSKIFAGILLVVVTGVASIPLWLGLALRPILQARHITFEHYERDGYAHFRLTHAVYQRDQVTVTVETIHSPTPLLWLSQWLRSGPALRGENWTLQIAPPSTPATAETPRTIYGPPDLRVALRARVWPRLNRWLPFAHLSHGVLRGPGLDLTIAETDWQRGTLHLQGVRRADYVFDLTATPTADESFSFSAQTADNAARAQLVWSGNTLKGDATLWDQPLQLAAQFPTRGWLPAEASVMAEHWSLPATRVKLRQPYATVTGRGQLTWHENEFTLSLAAAAEPAPGAKAPPFSAQVAAHGTLHQLTLTTLDVTAPFATAKLSAPVTLSFDRPLAAQSAQLVVDADLAKIPWLTAKGLVHGTIDVAGDTAAPRETFQLEFTRVELPGVKLRRAEVRGELAWPRLKLANLSIDWDEASKLEAQGTIDWQTRELIGASLQATLHSASLARWLPANVSWETAVIGASADGPLDAPHHRGTLTATKVSLPRLSPLQLNATWRGTGTKADLVTAYLKANHSRLELEGSIGPRGAQLDKLELTVAEQKIWQLAALTKLAWSPVWQLDPLQLSGPDSQLSLQGHGGPDGSFELKATRFDSAWLQDWITVPGPAWQLQSMQATGRVVGDVLTLDTNLIAQIETPSSPADVKLVAHADADGVQLKELTVTQSGRVLTQATGRFPVVGRLQPALHLQLDESAPFEFTGTTHPDSTLWESLSAATGLQLTRPEAKIKLTGSLREPRGDLELRVAQMKYGPTKSGYSFPEADDVALTVHLERDRVTLQHFSARLAGQAVTASGELPMSNAAWLEGWHHPAAFDWGNVEAKLEIPDADLGAIAHHSPNFIAALGHLRAKIEVARGRKFSGELVLADVSLRPLPPWATFQEINADFALDGHTLTVRKLTGRLGGEPVNVTGTVALGPDGPPHLDLAIKGSRLPLVRNSNLLIRSDLDLHVTTDPRGVTHLAGTARIRDSLALANFNSLLPSGPRAVTRVPPYFAIKTGPLQAWVFDVDVRGPEALKIRTAVFVGTATANFHLGGTFAEPRAVGSVAIDQGVVLFPFAVFKVQQGAIRLSEADPFHARVNVVATSQRRDYQLRLEATGQLPTPVITMSSTPALESTDVTLLVMTGRAPVNDTNNSSVQRLALLGAYLGRGIFSDLGVGGEDRLEISSGEQVTRQGQETYELEYKLGHRWSLVGEYDQFDSYNADVKWRAYIQESSPREQK